MNILFVNVTPLPHSIDLHSGLEDKGHNILFYYLKEHKSYYPWKSLSYKLEFKIIRKNIKGIFDILISCRKSDVIIITGWHSIIHVLVAIYSFLINKPFAYWLDIPRPPKRGIRKLVKKYLLKMADGYFITGLAGFKEFIQNYNLSKDKCYDFPYLEHKPDNEESIILNLNNRINDIKCGGKIRILLSNRFLPRKGYKTVYEAFKLLPARTCKKYTVSILGDGPEILEYRRLFTEIDMDIHLFGWVEYNVYLRKMNDSDIFIHASSHEPFGIPPMDAMARGKLVIGSKGVYSCLDRIRHKDNGLLFKKNSSEGLAKCIEWVSDDYTRIFKIGKKALKTSKNYGIDYNESAIKEFYYNTRG